MTPEQQRLRDAMASTPARVAAVVVSSAEMAPAPGEWSARENLLHLAAVEEGVWHARFDALASENFPHWPWTEPGLWSGRGDHTNEGALAAFTERRAATLARLDALDTDGWTHRGHHDTYGVLDVAALIRIALDHDEEHVAQIRGLYRCGSGTHPSGGAYGVPGHNAAREAALLNVRNRGAWPPWRR